MFVCLSLCLSLYFDSNVLEARCVSDICVYASVLIIVDLVRSDYFQTFYFLHFFMTHISIPLLQSRQSKIVSAKLSHTVTLKLRLKSKLATRQVLTYDVHMFVCMCDCVYPSVFTCLCSWHCYSLILMFIDAMWQIALTYIEYEFTECENEIPLGTHSHCNTVESQTVDWQWRFFMTRFHLLLHAFRQFCTDTIRNKMPSLNNGTHICVCYVWTWLCS